MAIALALINVLVGTNALTLSGQSSVDIARDVA